MNWSRRDFLSTSLAGLGAAAVRLESPDRAAAQTTSSTKAGKPAVLCSRSESWGRKVNGPAWQLLAGGADALDAAVAGAQVVELDPEDTSVGYGGLPNEEGVVQLDAQVISGRLRRAGAVAALERIKTPSAIARLVLERTNDVLLAGEGALRFAKAHGFKEEDLLTERARREWLEWKETLSTRDSWGPPSDGVEATAKSRPTGTINVLAIDARGDIAGCTSTSGLAFKLPGRVGDSPIVGAGLYVDNEVGAAGATGRGEETIKTCGSYSIVELMRRGLAPEEACLEALRRIIHWTRERPDFTVKYVALRRDGAAGCAAIWGSKDKPVEAALQTAQGFRIVQGQYLYEGAPAKR